MASFLEDWLKRIRGGDSGGQTVHADPIGTTGPTSGTSGSDPLKDAYGIDTSFYSDNWAKSARESKANWYHGQVNQTIGAAGAEANKLYGMEESRGQNMENIIAAALPEANKATLTDKDIRRSFGRETDAATGNLLGQMGSLRSYLGGAGITGGGMAAGLATGYQLARAGQMTDARRSLYLERAKTDALDRARNFQNQLTYASAVNRPVSMIRSDFLNNLAGIRLGQQGAEMQRSAAKTAAQASEQAGWMSLGGSLGGALIGAIL